MYTLLEINVILIYIARTQPNKVQPPDPCVLFEQVNTVRYSYLYITTTNGISICKIFP